MTPILVLTATLMLTPQMMIHDKVLCDGKEASIVFYNNSYYSFISRINNDGHEEFPIYKSHDLRTWNRSGQLFQNFSEKPKWASSIWSVGVVVTNQSSFLVYFVGRDWVGRYGVGIGTASNITGPYLAKDVPLMLRSNKKRVFLDPFVLYSGSVKPRSTLYYNEINLKSGKYEIYGSPMLNSTNIDWENAIKRMKTFSGTEDQSHVQSPYFTVRNGTYYMFYTCNFAHRNNNQGIGVARSKSRLGPFTALKRALILAPSPRAWLRIFAVLPKDGSDYHMVLGAYDTGDRHMDMIVRPFNWIKTWPYMYKDEEV